MRNFISILFLFIVACEQETSPLTTKSITLEEIVLVDTFTNLLVADTSAGLSDADFHPMYIGEKKDSISLAYYLGRVEAKYSGPENRFRLPYREEQINIFVDTTQFIGAVQPSAISKTFELKRGAIQSYSVFIENLTKDTLRATVGEYIPMLIEAIDSLGEWRRIQKNYIYECGTDMVNYYLPPRQILLTNCKLYTGTYRTRLRLVYSIGTNFSNEFWGTIDYRQFEALQEEYDFIDSEF